MPIDVEKLSQSSVGVQAIRRALKDADDSLTKEPSVDELKKIADLADAHNVYGFDAVQKNGKWVEQGIGSPGHETANHFASILRYTGRAEYEKAVREIQKRDPARHAKLGLPSL